MSGQPLLDFGGILAPTALEASKEWPSSGSVPVHSRSDRIPGSGRHVITCKRCGRTRRVKYKAALFCSGPCRTAYWHEKRGQVEERKKKRAMRGSAALNAGYLRIAREAAWRVLQRDGDADADRVRLLLESEGTVLPWTSGWPGSIFAADPDHDWMTVRRAKSRHKGGKCREIRVWE